MSRGFFGPRGGIGRERMLAGGGRDVVCLAARPAASVTQGQPMFIAMNRFKVVPGAEADFELVWTSRDTHLNDVPGFVEFHLLRGPTRDDHTLYSSHTIWQSRADFEAWTQSEAFRLAHRSAGDNRPLYLGHPEFEGFEVVQTIH
jgi:heme-degrading monooxygenase HmoA